MGRAFFIKAIDLSERDVVASPSIRDGWAIAACLCCGIIAPFVFIPFVILAGKMTPGYSQIRSTFSDSAAQGQPHPEIIGAGLLILAALLLAYAHGLSVILPRYQYRTSIAVLATAVSIGATGVFQDHNRSPFVQRNLEGYTHNFFAMTAIFSIIAASVFLNLGMASQPGWMHLRWPGIVVMVLITIAGSGFYVVGDSYDGLAERIFAAIALSWLVMVAASGLRLWLRAPGEVSASAPEETVGLTFQTTSESRIEG